ESFGPSATPLSSVAPSPTPERTPNPGSWTAAESLAAPRIRHTATLLLDGTVLVTGGFDGNGLLASVERYDPASGSWTAATSMIEARMWHTATLLPDGRVLVVGGASGDDGGILLTSAELYDPDRQTWTTTGSMVVARYGHTATLLPDGRVHVTSGCCGPDENWPLMASTELYDPGTGSWTAAGAGQIPGGPTATLLLGGQVLVVGSWGDVCPLVAVADLFDPSTGSWTVTRGMIEARPGHTATLLRDGKVLAAGGTGCEEAAPSELYDADAGSWGATGSLAERRVNHTATLLPDGRVLVVGGAGDNGNLDSAEQYDPVSGLWSAAGRMTQARASHTATLLLNGLVLVTGGDAIGSALASAELYDPGGGS
ncbi:MAG TPA: kelch repeat-containing protein, partial [Gemmatimonadales bacterium]|nr:kelch repeat-containing protein [Gemmatimonadales bacterium]